MSEMKAKAAGQKKVCIRCGVDCSTRPRTKDEQGRYTCRECFEALAGDEGARGAGAAKKSSPVITMVAADAGQMDPALGGLEEDPGVMMSALLDGAAVARPAAPATSPCPGCGHPLAASAAICTRCGFNRTTGAAVQTRQVAEEAGPARRGGPKSERDKVREFEERESERLARMEYVKPGVVVVLALVGVAVFLSANQNHTAMTLGSYLATFGASVVVAAAVHAIYALAKTGFDASFGLSALRLAAVVAATDLVRIPMVLFGGMDGFGQGALGTVLPIGMCIGLLYYFLDLDLLDAIILGVVMTGALFGVGYGITAAMGA